MEQLPQREFDATSVKPDGYLKVVFKSGPSHVFDFAEYGPWHWRDGYLIIQKKDNTGRLEIPELGIKFIEVQNNSERYTTAKSFLDAVDHIVDLEAHLERATYNMNKKRLKMLEANHGPVYPS
jgi:hypothetical protein